MNQVALVPPRNREAHRHRGRLPPAFSTPRTLSRGPCVVAVCGSAEELAGTRTRSCLPEEPPTVVDSSPGALASSQRQSVERAVRLPICQAACEFCAASSVRRARLERASFWRAVATVLTGRLRAAHFSR